MSRKLIINIHLYLAAFFTPVLIIISVSGGLYLLGIKGSVETKVIHQGAVSEFNYEAKDLASETTRFLKTIGVEHSFDYIKKKGKDFYTRPTSEDYYQISLKGNELKVIHSQPDFVKKIVELHKGHGPTWFKTYQKVVSVGLLIILITGLWLGLTSPMLKSKTIVITSAGLLTTLLLIIS